MAYKDKDKQREADKLRQQRRRDKVKQKGVTEQGVTAIPDTITIGDQARSILTMAIQQSQAQPKAILDNWYKGNGTDYQQQLATLGRQYTRLKA